MGHTETTMRLFIPFLNNAPFHLFRKNWYHKRISEELDGGTLENWEIQEMGKEYDDNK